MPAKLKARRVMVPRWVAADFGLRMNNSFPPCSTREFFRAKMARPAGRCCKARLRILWAAEKIEAALAEAISFMSELEKELRFYEGDGGVTRASAALMKHSAMCFNPTAMTTDVSNDAIASFRELFTLLLPELEFTLWPPNSPEWAWLERRWPSQDAMVSQYIELCRRAADVRRVHEDGLRAGKIATKCWVRLSNYKASDLSRAWSLISSVSKSWATMISDPILLHLILTFGEVSSFFCTRSVLRSGAKVPVGLQPWCIDVSTVWKLGTVCNFVSDQTCRAVVIVDYQTSIDHVAFVQTLETDRDLAKDVWHCLRMWHRACRICDDSEARAESWVGALSSLWDPTQGLATSSLTDRLTIKLSGARGNGQDDHVVKSVLGMVGESSLF